MTSLPRLRNAQMSSTGLTCVMARLQTAAHARISALNMGGVACGFPRLAVFHVLRGTNVAQCAGRRVQNLRIK
jgi:hypothetical protein